jgi:hypothetical protein
VVFKSLPSRAQLGTTARRSSKCQHSLDFVRRRFAPPNATALHWHKTEDGRVIAPTSEQPRQPASRARYSTFFAVRGRSAIHFTSSCSRQPTERAPSCTGLGNCPIRCNRQRWDREIPVSRRTSGSRTIRSSIFAPLVVVVACYPSLRSTGLKKAPIGRVE